MGEQNPPPPRFRPQRPRSLIASARRDGKLKVRARGLPLWSAADIYHQLMGLTWPMLFLLFAGLFLVFNLGFAAIYRCDPSGLAIAHGGADMPLFLRDFFFSVHTVATIGYGNIYPLSLWANVVVVIEVTLGIMIFALATGIAFARFSRPTARMLFSAVMVVHDVDGVPTVMLRAANQRHNVIYSAEARLSLLIDDIVGGLAMRRFVDLRLERSSNPVFALTWTIMHRIDESSPLYPWLGDRCGGTGQEIMVLLSGIDEVSGQMIHGRWAYGAGDIRWGMRFDDIVTSQPDGWRTIDYLRFHEVVPHESVT